MKITLIPHGGSRLPLGWFLYSFSLWLIIITARAAEDHHHDNHNQHHHDDDDHANIFRHSSTTRSGSTSSNTKTLHLVSATPLHVSNNNTDEPDTNDTGGNAAGAKAPTATDNHEYRHRSVDKDPPQDHDNDKDKKTTTRRFIVRYQEAQLARQGVTAQAAAGSLADQVSPGAVVLHTYSGALLSGFVLQITDANDDDETTKEDTKTLLEQVQARLLPNPLVRDIVVDEPMYLNNNKVVQTENLPWGLDRIDDLAGLDGSFEYPSHAGEGIDMYIIDSGINVNHLDFAGRIAPDAEHTNAVNWDESASGGPPFPVWGDCQGHGTHVASTAAGTYLGVAKLATIHSVRVFDCAGTGYQSVTMAGMEFVLQTCTAHNQNCVVNMSLGGAASQPYNDLVATLVANGLTVVVAAGNQNQDACVRSPASADAAITVGATTSSDIRSYFSNWGPCVDIFAPGSDVMGADYACDNCIVYDSGTSMASPLVAGVAALIVQDMLVRGQSSPVDPTLVKSRLLETEALVDILTDVGVGSPNRFVQMTTVAHSEAPSPGPTETAQPSRSVAPSAGPTDSAAPSTAPTVVPTVVPSAMPSEFSCPGTQVYIELLLTTDFFRERPK